MIPQVVIALLLLLSSVNLLALDDCVEFLARCKELLDEKTSQSFMFPRPIYRNLAAQLSTGWTDCIYDKPGCMQASLQAVGIYQQTRPYRSVNQYFLFNNKTSLIIKGENAPQAKLRDVRAEWLLLPSDFSGVMTIKPEQKQGGLWLEYNQNIRKFIDHKFFDSWWFGIALPVQFVENDIKITQTFVLNPGPANGPADIIEAFNQGTWNYGKFNPNSMKKAGLAELMFKLGATFMDRDGFQIGYYNNFILPLAGGQDAAYIFSPFLGNNKHFGFGIGLHFQLPLNECTENNLFAFFFDIESIYLLRRKQLRTFDLRGRPWTRFLLMTRRDGTGNIPGVNVLTFPVHLYPFNLVDLSTGFRFKFNHFDLQIGYDLWAHGDEKVGLHALISDLQSSNFRDFGVQGNLPGQTATDTSTIDFLGPLDLGFRSLRISELDLQSGIARAAVTHRVHLATGAVVDMDCYTGFFGIGGFIEFPQQDTALANWGAWAKFGGSF
jgi:hypothetical protein